MQLLSATLCKLSCNYAHSEPDKPVLMIWIGVLWDCWIQKKGEVHLCSFKMIFWQRAYLLGQAAWVHLA